MPAMSTATSGVPSADAGAASATVNAAQQIGGSLGTALLNTIAATATTWYFATHPSPVSAQENTTIYGFTVALGVATAILLVTAALMPSRTRWQWRPDHQAGAPDFDAAVDPP